MGSEICSLFQDQIILFQSYHNMNTNGLSMRKRITWADVLLVIILIVVGIVFWTRRNQTGSGTRVKVYSENELILDLPLNQNYIGGVNKDIGNNTLIIEDGYAYVTDSDCPDKICEQMGKISKPGETIVCLPHKLVVEISDE